MGHAGVRHALVALVLIGGCRCDRGLRPIGAELTVTPRTIDFGVVARGSPEQRTAVRVTNTGQIELLLEPELVGAESFAAAEAPLALAPGASVEVEVTCLTARSGDQVARLSLLDAPEATVDLHVELVAPEDADAGFDAGRDTVGDAGSDAGMPAAAPDAGDRCLATAEAILVTGRGLSMGLRGLVTSTGYTLTWSELPPGGGEEPYLGRFDFAGTALQPHQSMNPLSSALNVDFSGSEYGVAEYERTTSGTWRLHFARALANGIAVDAGAVPVTVGTGSGNQLYATVAWSPVQQQWGVAWFEDPAQFSSTIPLHFERFDATGARVPGSHVALLTAGAAFSITGHSLIANATGWAFATQYTWGWNSALRLTQITPSGVSTQNLLPSAVQPAGPVIVWTGAGYGVAWVETEWVDAIPEIRAVHFARLDAAGNLVPGSEQLLAPALPDTAYGWLSIAALGNTFAVAWENNVVPTGEVWAAKISPAGLAAGYPARLSCGVSARWPEALASSSALSVVLARISTGLQSSDAVIHFLP